MNLPIIAVPIRIEAKYLEADKMVCAPLADFKKLPWNDGKNDINYDVPFLRDSIMHHPFHDQNYLLKKGLHLHFILPHFLGQQIPKNAGLEKKTDKLPAAPNRWLITKKKEDGSTTQKWIIESDYIYPMGYDPYDDVNGIPPLSIIPYKSNDNSPPFRYMGRTTLVDSQRPKGNTFKSLNKEKPLTVIGYGNINFSSYYPNCAGVFGFYDKNAKVSDTSTYSIIGWNDAADDDLLHTVTKEYFKKDSISEEQSAKDVQTKIKNLFKVDVFCDDLSLFDKDLKTVYFGEFTLDAVNEESKSELKIAIGASSTEALSAMIAAELSSNSDKDITSKEPASSAKKGEIEEQLESMLLFSKLDHLIADTGPKFLEARHEKGFRSSHSGHIWRIITKNTSEGNTEEDDLPLLPASLAGLLHTLNLAQNDFDTNHHKIKSLKEQLYLDWYKYMQASYPIIEGPGEYPDPDHIRYFLKTYAVEELNTLINTTGSVDKLTEIIKVKTFNVEKTKYTEGPHKIQNAFKAAWFTLNNSLTKENEKRSKNKQLDLAMSPGPRFWEPNPPAILISGLPLDPDNNATDKTENRYLKCLISELENPIEFDVTKEPIQLDTKPLQEEEWNKIKKSNSLSNQLWNPFMLDWEVELNLKDLNLQYDDSGDYRIDDFKKYFDIDQFGPELKLIPDYEKKNSSVLNENRSVFSGSTIMSSNAKTALLLNIKSFISNTLKQENIHFEASQANDAIVNENGAQNKQPSKKEKTLYSVDDLLQLKETDELTMLRFPEGYISLKNITDFGRHIPAFKVAYNAYNYLQDKQFLSQILGGFNDACIMRKKAPQLPIAEPLGFSEAKKFTSELEALVGHNQHASPITEFNFNPIRTGNMTINRLRLIDNFGAAHDLSLNVAAIAETLQDKQKNNQIFLPPRLAQPARLNFRWLSATPVSTKEKNYRDTSNIEETNDHPNTSPICGWLMANLSDNTLAVFTPDGSALGYVDANADWQLLPWASEVNNIEDNIPNIYTQQVVKWLVNKYSKTQNKNPPKWTNFLNATRAALHNIAPSNAQSFNTKTLLMGKPMAVVMSRISFQTGGVPALNQSWASLLTDLNTCDSLPEYKHKNRINNNWTKVKLPVRLGEHHQLNDGLVGYWIEDKKLDAKTKKQKGISEAKFISPEITADDVIDAAIETYSESNHQTQWLAINDPINICMLMDPRGLTHATTGLLPTKALSIPTHHYLDAMNKLSMWFYASHQLQPISATKKTVVMNLPQIVGYQWKWWDKFNDISRITKDDLKKNIQTPSFIMEGWLYLSPDKAKAAMTNDNANKQK